MIDLRSLSPRLKLVAATVTLAILPACSTPEKTDDMTAEGWREDLRFLEETLTGKHIDPFRIISEEDFRGAVTDLDARIPSLSDAAIQVEMCRLVASIGDGHTELNLPRQGLGFGSFPLGLYVYDEDIVVRVTTETVSRALGARIVAVEGTPVEDVVEAVRPLISRDNDIAVMYATPALLTVPDILFGLGLTESRNSATLTFEKDAKRFDLELPALSDEEYRAATWVRARDGSPTPLHYQNRDRWYWFEYLEANHTLYVKLDRSEDQGGQPTITRFARELYGAFDSNRVNRFVLDVRNNGSGDERRNEPIIAGIEERKGELKRGKIIVITGRATFSAGTAAALDMEERCDAVFVGEPGRGNPNTSDDCESLVLPNSNILVEYATGLKEHSSRYKGLDRLPVDVVATNDFQDYRSGRDRVIEAALKR